MIIDRLENWKHYRFGPEWELAFEFLASLDANSPTGKYDLQGEDVFAQVQSYSTRTPEDAIIESHRRYVDIQAVLAGAEGIEWHSRNSFDFYTHYDESKDAEFYKRVSPSPTRVDVFPGIFVMLYPWDAHMPTLMVGEEPQVIKKVVVKIKASLLMAEGQ